MRYIYVTHDIFRDNKNIPFFLDIYILTNYILRMCRNNTKVNNSSHSIVINWSCNDKIKWNKCHYRIGYFESGSGKVTFKYCRDILLLRNIILF